MVVYCMLELKLQVCNSYIISQYKDNLLVNLWKSCCKSTKIEWYLQINKRLFILTVGLVGKHERFYQIRH